MYADLAQMEDVLRESGLDWTVVRPVRLTGKPVTGRYRTAFGQNVRRGLFISRADVANYMLRVIGEPGTFRQTVEAGPPSDPHRQHRFARLDSAG
jgi:uncharacterized protein YbjT (DUF2867 family)